MRNPESRDYIRFGEPFARGSAEIYADAAKELLVPFPSTPLSEFPALSRITGGLRPREFTILCGATGIGKTTLNACLSKSLIIQGVPHFVASVETGKTDFLKRVISAFAAEDWNTGDPVHLHKFQDFNAKHIGLFKKNVLQLSLYENRFSVEQLMNDIAWMVKNRGVKIALIDNLNFFMEVKKAADQLIEMDRVIHELVIFCKQVDVHVIMVMHPKKTEGGRVESEFDIKGSSTAVQEAHNVLLFNRAGDDLIEAGLAVKGDREIKIAKMRRKGRSVGLRIVMKAVHGVLYHEGDVCELQGH